MNISKPLATALANGKPVRYFRAPIEGTNFPWHAFLDLHAAMGLTDGVQEHFLRMMRSGPYRNATRVLATAEGPTVIAAHYVAQGFVSAMIEMRETPPDFEVEYYRGLSNAIDAQSIGMPEVAKFDLVIEMGRRHIAVQAVSDI